NCRQQQRQSSEESQQRQREGAFRQGCAQIFFHGLHVEYGLGFVGGKECRASRALQPPRVHGRTRHQQISEIHILRLREVRGHIWRTIQPVLADIPNYSDHRGPVLLCTTTTKLDKSTDKLLPWKLGRVA